MGHAASGRMRTLGAGDLRLWLAVLHTLLLLQVTAKGAWA